MRGPPALPAKQRTVYRPGEVRQFDFMHLRRKVPVGYGQPHKGYFVVAVLAYSRAGAGCLVVSRRAADIVSGLWHYLERFGELPRRLVTDCGPPFTPQATVP